MKMLCVTWLFAFVFLPLSFIPEALAAPSLAVDTSASLLRWTGRKVSGEHTGTLQVKNGTVTISKGEITGGSFELDMASIKNINLPSVEKKTKLENHLKSKDFFKVESFPLARFTLDQVIAGNVSSEYTVHGTLVVKGISKKITFPATIQEENGVYVANAKFSIDRSKWDIRYNSGKFFDIGKLGDKLIYDEVAIELDLRTIR